MTMVPAQTVSKQQHHHLYGQLYYGGYESEEHENNIINYNYSLGGSGYFLANPMAEDESKTNMPENEEQVVASTSKDESWLQLSIGPHRAGLVELDLLPGSGSGRGETVISQQDMTPTTPMVPIFHVPQPPREAVSGCGGFGPFFIQQQHNQAAVVAGSSGLSIPQQEINWTFRPAMFNLAPPSNVIQLGSYYSRPVQLLHGSGSGGAGSSLDFRVIDPPRRPHSGIWFSLQASPNQAKEPFLPQIPKSCLRIRDGRMTIRLIKAYLVKKLQLDSESEVEITCRGQQLLPLLTLEHVRDNIWNPRDGRRLNPPQSPTTLILLLHYGRTA